MDTSLTDIAVSTVVAIGAGLAAGLAVFGAWVGIVYAGMWWERRAQRRNRQWTALHGDTDADGMWTGGRR